VDQIIKQAQISSNLTTPHLYNLQELKEKNEVTECIKGLWLISDIQMNMDGL
jgi:hypothetical protein